VRFEIVQVLLGTSLGSEYELGAADATGAAAADVGQDPGWAGLQPPGIPGMEVKAGTGVEAALERFAVAEAQYSRL
jgi:hypothetical protein